MVQSSQGTGQTSRVLTQGIQAVAAILVQQGRLIRVLLAEGVTSVRSLGIWPGSVLGLDRVGKRVNMFRLPGLRCHRPEVVLRLVGVDSPKV